MRNDNKPWKRQGYKSGKDVDWAEGKFSKKTFLK